MAPLTGFFGTNSSGKTAILQFLLMLKQTVESSDRQRILHLGGDRDSYVDLGTTYDISHNHHLPKKIEFSLTWVPHTITPISPVLPLVPVNDRNYKSSLKFESAIDIDSDRVNIDFFRYTLDILNPQLFSCIMRVLESGQQEPIYRLLIESTPFKDLGNLNSSLSDIPIKPIKNYGCQSISTRHLPTEVELLLALIVHYESLFQNTYYLAPLREYPQRTYLWSGESPQNVGNRGELAVAALLASRKKDSDVEISVARSLKDLGLIHSFRLQAINKNRGDYEILVQRSPNSPEVLITDVGFGVSQILPILVLCYYVPKGSTVIFEQPEIHLHPSVQAGLADVLIDVIKTRNLQIIIESHSEHLLRRLQRRIAEEKDGFTNEDAALYFCNMSDRGDSELVSLELDPFGNISNWPDGFFGDEMGDLVAMTEASIKRQMNVGG